MKRRIVKVTLNDLDVFDSVLLAYLEGKRNASGELKKLAYNCIVLQSTVTRQPGPKEEGMRSVSDANTEIDNKLSKMLEI